MAQWKTWPNTLSVDFLEGLYADYLRDPASIDPQWRAYFDQLSPERNGFNGALGPSFRPPPLFSGGGSGNGSVTQEAEDLAALQDRVDQLIRNYRVRGHMNAELDPLGRRESDAPELELSYYDFTEDELDRPLSTLFIPGADVRTLRQIYRRMRNTYCRSIGVQFMHISDPEIRQWLQRRMEATENRVELAREEQLRIFTRLTDAVIFERFLHTKYVGAKTFSLEGAESLIPLLDLAIEKAADQGVVEIVLGMAHRGRLNVLANVLGKSPRDIFREFEDVDPSRYTGRGDVKYHLGYSNDWVAANGRRVHLSLCFNPSHLEYINPVAVGRMRAKQDRCYDREHFRGMVVLIHGDAGFAGEGIVQETLSMSELKGYGVGGTLHVIVNNQIGFTTNPAEGRSTEYATDVARMLQSPIFHVNGEDPEAVAQVVRLAMDFRAKFQRDVVIDMYCYRKYGHNEGDEPSFTQPTLYQEVAKRKSVRDGYLDRLMKTGLSEDEAQQIEKERTQMLEEELSVARSDDYVHTAEAYRGIWSGYQGGAFSRVEPVESGIPLDRINDLLRRLTDMPAGFKLHRKLKRYFDQRREMVDGEKPLDWATAEALAIASLAVDGHRIRMSGQDSIRGTFSHRHSTLYDQETGEPFSPFQHLSDDQAPVEVYNSPLNEAGVLGFEYGYSLDCPEGLVIWEAQFGDFVNAAQVIIDQFIASAEDKWHRLSGLVMLLPHGFEGQGPEHSSARLERFLALAAEDNIQIAYPTTPAQYFHLLRRQLVSRWRKPLVVMTPKSLLRHPLVVSDLAEFTRGHYQLVIGDDSHGQRDHVERVLLCSGKIYYDLVKQREELGRDDVAIARLEQLYPYPADSLRDMLSRYDDGTPVVWVQEEPENMGAWRYIKVKAVRDKLFGRFPLTGVTRPESASPATGSAASHRLEQADLLDRAFGEIPAPDGEWTSQTQSC